MSTEKKSITANGLATLVEKFVAEGRIVYAPVRKGTQLNFEQITDISQMDGDYIRTVRSAKFTVFPKVEKILEFSKAKKAVEQTNIDPETIPEVVLIGARPCDAAGFASLNAIFTWDYVDTLFTTRLKRLTIIGMSCSQCDEYCFCTSVNGGPGNTNGSDILLTKTGNDGYLAEIVTEKGKAVADASGLFGEAKETEKEKYLADVKAKFSLSEIESRIQKAFDKEEMWVEQSLRCLGCGSCAFVCPTCACFDIQDEGNHQKGNRVRCWDSCGFSIFTLHTSGHNPREVQSQRWRQRIMHKFAYMPERQQVIGCVGCGRCSASCPVDMNISEHLKNITEVQI